MSEFSLGSVEVSLSPSARFAEFLQSRGKRLTQQKQLLLETIFKRHEHFDADDLIDELRQDKSNPKKASRPTVYRTLNELVEAGLLKRMNLNGRAVYEHDYGYPQHDHLYCEQCQKLFEFQSDELLELRDQVGRQNKFRVTGHRLIINGICEECTLAKRRRKRSLDRV
jgi:Fur family ferric uptake transcriptional regulator